MQLIACGFCAAALLFTALSVKLAVENNALLSQPANPLDATATIHAAFRSQPSPAAPALTAAPTQPASLTPPTAGLATVRAARTAAPACSDNAAFVADVTVPDGTAVAAGQPFYKIWRVLNTGTCAWGDGYAFTFVDGERMGANATGRIPATPPGAFADLRVPMAAPTTDGVHRGYWRLRNPRGAYMSITLYVTITVVSPPATPTATPTFTLTFTPAPAATIPPTETPTP